MSDPLDDLEKPSAARMYDYYLGGYHNTAADRALAEQAMRLSPDVVPSARANRAFLRRAVEFMLDQGIDQFLDLGSGIPTKGNVHEIVAQYNPQARIVYVDIDPVAVVMSERILGDNPHVGVIQADARDTHIIAKHPITQRLLDFSRPLGVLIVSLLHFIPNDRHVQTLVERLHALIAPGSYLALSHMSFEGRPPELVAQGKALYKQSVNPLTDRSAAQILALMDGFELVEPGLVHAPLWRPDGPDDPYLDHPERISFLAAVGRKR